jgi:dihydrofolate reductase/uncharacterized protein YndB with AHSA1/START domain
MSDDVRFAREIDATTEKVFDAFTQRGGQEAFYGTDDPGWIVESECDLRVGGVWTVTFGRSPDELHRHDHVFRVIDRPSRLVVDTTETRADGSSLEFETEFTFEERDGKTLMTMIQRGLPTAELREEHRAGLPNAFARLERAIETESPVEAGRSELRPQTRKGDTMSATILYMSMSLDGFIAGPNESLDNGLGDGGERLHEWASGEPDEASGVPGRPSGVNGQIYDQMMSTGAVVAGKGTFEPAGGWGVDHHDGVPIWILSRREPGIDVSQWPLVTYVADIATAMTEAKRAAGDMNVLVHGAATAQLALAAGLLDELELHVIPVLFGQGRRLFENLDPEQIELERTRMLEGEAGVTHMHYRVQR